MKKILLLMAILTFSLLLVACGDKNGNGDDNGDDPIIDTEISVEQKSYELNGNTHTYVFTVSSNHTENLESIANSVATSIYNKNKDTYGSTSHFLKITYELNGNVVLTQMWQVNRNIENMGLTLLNSNPAN